MLVFSFRSNSERLSLRRALDTDMSKLEKEATLRSVLLETAKSGERLRFFGPGMMIVAEGRVAFVGEDIVGLYHGETKNADEYVCIECVIKIQIIGEYRHY